jgi:hypothetical protein
MLGNRRPSATTRQRLSVSVLFAASVHCNHPPDCAICNNQLIRHADVLAAQQKLQLTKSHDFIGRDSRPDLLTALRVWSRFEVKAK